MVICCHNSAARLPETLAHLAAQQVPSDLKWEVLVVDNASTDDTHRVAAARWPRTSPAPCRIVSEPQAGLCHARNRAFAEARYPIISFIDDDNWVCSDWVARVDEIMAAHPRVGACGGRGMAAFETEPPAWFPQYENGFALGEQSERTGSITQPDGCLWGAGMSLRVEAWRGLQERGFAQLLTGRLGKQLTAGEDTELSYALRLAGWDLWYDPRLTYQHYMPALRLTWSYLRRLNQGFGAASVFLEPYRLALTGTLESYRGHLLKSWLQQTYWGVRRLLSYGPQLRLSAREFREGDLEVIGIERRIGRVRALLRGPSTYRQAFQGVLDAPWRCPPSEARSG